VDIITESEMREELWNGKREGKSDEVEGGRMESLAGGVDLHEGKTPSVEGFDDAFLAGRVRKGEGTLSNHEDQR